MNAKELMLDDLLYLNRRPVRVDAIGFNGSISYSEKGGFGCIGVDKLSLIPITEEMLEKNTKKVEGFTGWLYWLDVKEQCYVRKYDGEYTFMYKRGFADACIPIEFVHQLQHCLKMFGISKEIVL